MSLEGTMTKDRTAAPPTIMHTVECGRSSFVTPNREKEAMVREAIARMVAVLAEAGKPVPITDICTRIEGDGWVPYWPEACKTAIRERTVWSPEDGMLCLPQKMRQMSPEAQARHRAFDKAEELGVVKHTGERFVFTDRQDDGLLTPSEMEMVERQMNRCNALGKPEVHDMYILCHEGKVTKETLRAYTRGVIERAEAQPLAYAQDGARRQKGSD